MMRYFFHSIDGEINCDEEGIELANSDEAVARATREVRILAAESILTTGKLLLHERIDVTDAAGIAVISVAVRDAVSIED